MSKSSGGTRLSVTSVRSLESNGERNYYTESRRLRKEAIEYAETLKGNPKTFHIDGINGVFELTKSDIKTIVSKNTSDNKFNAIKNAIAKDIEGYLRKANYTGWRETVPGKHPESEYFEYYDRTIMIKTYLCVRVMKGSGIKKPYAIIDQNTFKEEVGSVHKEKR